MITENQAPSPREWAVEHFGGAELSHLKRVDRAITIAEALAASPGKSLPQIFAHPYDLTATDPFFRHPEATPDKVQAGHGERVLGELEQPGCYLSDGLPGWITLWRGWQILPTLVEGVLIARKLTNSG